MARILVADDEPGLREFIVDSLELDDHTVIPAKDGREAAKLLDEVLDRQLMALSNESTKDLLDARYEKFRKMGQFFDLGN